MFLKESAGEVAAMRWSRFPPRASLSRDKDVDLNVAERNINFHMIGRDCFHRQRQKRQQKGKSNHSPVLSL